MSAQVEVMRAQAVEMAATATQLQQLVAGFPMENGAAPGAGVTARRRADDWASGRAAGTALRAI